MNQFLAATQNINDIPCGGAEVLRTIKFAMTMIDIICFIIPIILILIITVGFAKNVIANNVDDMKKEFILIVKKIIMCVGIFFIPLIDLFQVQWANLQERREIELEEEEYEKNMLNEKLIDEEDNKKNVMEEEVWDDEKYDKENNII